MNHLTLPHLRTPININFDLTYNCNAKCKFCFISNKLIHDRFQSKKKIFKIIDKLFESNIFRINFFGGEPSLHPDILEIIKYAKEQNFKVTLVTNSLAFNKSNILEYEKYLDGIGVSLHGPEKIHNYLMGVLNAYKQALFVIEHFSKANKLVGVNFTLTKENYKYFYDTALNLCEHYHIGFVAISRFISSDDTFLGKELKSKYEPDKDVLNYTLEKMNILQEQYPLVDIRMSIFFPLCIVKNPSHKKFLLPCSFGQNYCTIDYNGNIKLCSYGNAVIGNILEDNFEEIWKSNPLLIKYRSCEWFPTKCRNCPDFPKCLGGCKVTNKSKSFSVDKLAL